MSIKNEDSWTVSKALTKKSNWTDDKDSLLDVIYWGRTIPKNPFKPIHIIGRQIISLLIGILFGLIPLKGLIAILLYVAISTFVGHFYVTSFQEVDEEELGGFMELSKEGFGSAFATFLVAWIGVYTLHFE